MELIRWGMIGCGNVTEVKSGPGFYKARGSRLAAVMRRDGAKAADYARRHNVPKWYDNAEALIADREIDAVYVATPPGTHESYAMKVLGAGKPCYVEKPMARNTSEARRMVEAFAAAKVPLYVAYYRRALPRFLKVKELIDSGELGRVVSADCRYADGRMQVREEPAPWRVVPEESGGGQFMDMTAHALDLLDFWLGPLEVVTARAENAGKAYAVEDHVSGSLRVRQCRAAGGEDVPVTVDANFCAPPQDEMTIVGERATARISCFGNEAVRVTAAEGRTRTFDLPNPEHVAMPLIQTVVDALLGKGVCASTGESGLRTQEVMDTMLRDFYGTREDGFWRNKKAT